MINLIAALPLLLMGIYNLLGALGVVRFKSRKFSAMREAYGEGRGRFIYTLFYSIMPLVFALLLIYLSIKGVSFLDVI